MLIQLITFASRSDYLYIHFNSSASKKKMPQYTWIKNTPAVVYKLKKQTERGSNRKTGGNISKFTMQLILLNYKSLRACASVISFSGKTSAKYFQKSRENYLLFGAIVILMLKKFVIYFFTCQTRHLIISSSFEHTLF